MPEMMTPTATLTNVIGLFELFVATYYFFGTISVRLPIVLFALEKTKNSYFPWGKCLKVKLNLAAILILHLSLS